MPGQNWTYIFQAKDQIGSYFYFPSLLFQKAAGGYGPIRLNNRDVIPIPFPQPDYEYDIMIGDWYNANHQDLRNGLDNGYFLPLPDGILINGLGPNQAIFNFQPGATYRLRISNVGLRTSLNFRIKNHPMLLVEAEGSYTLKQYYNDLDIHVGQSYSVLVTAMNQTTNTTFQMLVAPRFFLEDLLGIGIINYSRLEGQLPNPSIFPGTRQYDYGYSLQQAQSIRMDLSAGAARPNPQGSFRYSMINITRTLVLKSNMEYIKGKSRYTVNGVSFVAPDTPLKLADYFNISGVFESGMVPDIPPSADSLPSLGVSVIDTNYHDFVHVVFENPHLYIDSWHFDGHSFFVVGMGFGTWDESKMSTYNMVDGIYRATIQVYPLSWTAVLVKLDNYGMWNLRSQDAQRRYLGQELYIRVKWPGNNNDPTKVSPRDEYPIPGNAIKCGKAAFL
ncbi:hypothetical protein ACH5RR_035246 [Cinchona calisaya]|uniref:Uncharacterized protein n=1 Tax=Cinchona calisaya TaxID=153742 RepID=A0ABD2YHP5_9GENT